MPFTVTVHLRRRRARAVDVAIEVPTGGTATVAQLRSALADLLGEPVDGLIADCGRLSDESVVGDPPLVHGAELALGPAAEGPLPSDRPADPTPLEVVVVSGPDVGHRLPLPSTGLVVGRGGGADLVLDDPDVSRRHLRLVVTSQGVLAEDLCSVNGTVLGGHPVTQRVVVPLDGRLRIGSSTIVLRRSVRARLPVSADGAGRLVVHRAPRVRPPAVSREVAEPVAPGAAGRVRMPWVAALAPLPVALILALVLGPHYLLFAAGGPVLVLATSLADRTGRRRGARGEQAAYASEAARARRDLDAALAEEARERRAAHPDPAQILALATGPAPRLWERSGEDPDLLEVRVGTAPLPAQVRWTRPDRPAEHPVIDDLPVVVDLALVNRLGVVGPRAAALDVARGIVGRLAALVSPADLRITRLTSDEEWSWVDRLPHVWPQELETPFAAAEPGTTDRPAHLLIVDAGDASPADTDTLGALRQHTASVVIAPDIASLPPGCGAVLEVAPGDESRLRVDGVADVRGIVPDRPRWWWSVRLSRSLAPLRDPRTDVDARAAPPDEVRLLEILPVDATDPVAVRDRWVAPEGPVAVLGATRDGPWCVDLRRDGPHALIGGTTGAGKSELLQALVGSLAVLSPPEELSIVLVDYKGGSAFAGCADLPHVVGLVTDLDDHLADRALVSLRAELTRRERVLATVGARDIDDYLIRRPPGGPGLGRLVIVVDELRALAEELPAFVDGLVRIAAVGRSLGVHLVLATQRPSGVVSPEIRANVNLRVALRVRDRADSHDVIDLPDAALVPAGRPGRGLARTGAEAPTTFQGARVSAAAPGERPDRLVVQLAGGGANGAGAASGAVPPGRGMPAAGPTDLDRLVAAARAAQRDRPAPPPHRPWLPALPARLAPLDPEPDTDAVLVGLADHPGEQRREPLRWRPDGGHWLLVGGPRSGRTTAAVTLATTAAARWATHELHIHAIAAGGRLRPVAALPNTGTVVGPDDPERLDLLLTRLADEVRRRAGAPEPATSPAVLLLVDGWDRAADPDLLGGTVGERLTALLRDGASVGLSAVVTGDRSLVLGRTAALMSETFVLRLADPVDAALVGLDRSAVPHDPPPGRAVRVRDGVEIQFALPHPGPPPPVAASSGRACRPVRVEPLPTLALPPAPGAAPPWTLGIGGDDASWVSLDPAVAGRLLLVVGPPGSGRSTALGSLALAAQRAGRRVAVVASRRGPPADLATMRGIVLASPHDVADLVAARRAHPDLVVLVDDADGLAGSPAEAVLDEIAALVDRDDGVVVAAATPAGVLGQVRGVVVEAARRQRGLLLAPSGPGDGAVLGVAVPRGLPVRPGRGLLVAGGPPVRVQVAGPTGAG